MRPVANRTKRGQRGLALVEMLLVPMVLVVLTFGGMELPIFIGLCVAALGVSL